MLQTLGRFYELAKRHTVISVLLSIGAVISFVSSMLSILSLTAYLRSTLLFLLLVAASAFLFWVSSNPQKKVTDPLGLNSREEAYFPALIRKLAAGGGVLMLLMSVAGAYWLRPQVKTYARSIRALLQNVETIRGRIKTSGNTFELFKRYENARLGGPGFWYDVNRGMEIPVSEVATHNSLLLSFINDSTVPLELLKNSPPNLTAIDLAWIGDPAMESQVKILIDHYIKADRTLIRIREIQTQNPQVFETATMLNEELCRYYELILNADCTYLNDETEMKKATAAEKQVADWLKHVP